MSLIISSGTGRKNAVLTMLLCFSLWKRTDYSLRQHQPLYPEKSTGVKAKSEFNMKKFARIGKGGFRAGDSHCEREQNDKPGQNLRRRLMKLLSTP